METRTEYLKSIWEQKIQRRLEGESEFKTLIDVAAGHGTSLHPDNVPVGIGPDSPVIKITGGYNGKRCIYAVKTDNGRWEPAYGTYMGNQSGFSFRHVEDVIHSLMTEQEETRYNFLPPEEGGKLYFGFALADSMLPEGTFRKTVALNAEVAKNWIEGKNVVSCLNPSHKATIEAMRVRYEIDVPIPDTPPQVKLSSKDVLIVMGVRGLPRLTDRHEYTREEIEGATFTFSMYKVI